LVENIYTLFMGYIEEFFCRTLFILAALCFFFFVCDVDVLMLLVATQQLNNPEFNTTLRNKRGKTCFILFLLLFNFAVMFKISLKSVTFIGLSVLAITSEAFRPIHQRFNAQKFASSKNLVKMNSNPNPTTDQANWKQSMSNMINTGVATATLLGLTTVAFAEGTEAVAGNYTSKLMI
jgi:hypothetical protein